MTLWEYRKENKGILSVSSHSHDLKSYYSFTKFHAIVLENSPLIELEIHCAVIVARSIRVFA